MTQEQINRKCAELDGFKSVIKMVKEWDVIDYNGNGEWVETPREMFERDGASVFPKSLPNYTTSYDAILPLIQKQTEKVQWNVFNHIVANGPKHFTLDNTLKLIRATPLQLCEALLRATGKWEEEAGLSPR